MAQQNRISVTIPPAVHDELMKHIADIKTLVTPFLHPLTVEERSGLSKMGDKSQPFVEKALEYAKLNKEFLAPTVSLEEWQKDFDAWEDLVPLKNQVAQLLSDLDDTVMLLGSEAYDPARWYYNLAKLSADRGEASAKPIVDDLSKRFTTVKRKKPVAVE